jgi:thioredoxin-dependent peroxiredoxin
MAKVPAFSLSGSDGMTYSAKTLKGTPFVLYFYPRDATPGCTTEACDFRDRHQVFAKHGVKVFGVSPDSLSSHEKFAAKQHLPFVLLSDENHAFAEKMSVWTKKTLYGRNFMGIERSTFLVGADGAIVKEWRRVRVSGHVTEVLAEARSLVKKV